MKKIVCILTIAVIMAAAMSTTAFAHGGHRRGGYGTMRQAPRQTGYALCLTEGCEIIYSHQHGENWYCGQAGLSGDYDICRVSGCTAIGLHEHDSEYYHCQNYNAGDSRGRGCCR